MASVLVPSSGEQRIKAIGGIGLNDAMEFSKELTVSFEGQIRRIIKHRNLVIGVSDHVVVDRVGSALHQARQALLAGIDIETGVAILRLHRPSSLFAVAEIR